MLNVPTSSCSAGIASVEWIFSPEMMSAKSSFNASMAEADGACLRRMTS